MTVHASADAASANDVALVRWMLSEADTAGSAGHHVVTRRPVTQRVLDALVLGEEASVFMLALASASDCDVLGRFHGTACNALQVLRLGFLFQLQETDVAHRIIAI